MLLKEYKIKNYTLKRVLSCKLFKSHDLRGGHRADLRGLKSKKESHILKQLPKYMAFLEREGFGPSKAKPTDLQSAPFDRSGTSP